MTIEFKYGFEYKGFTYGWSKKELYRLPSVSGNKSYGLKKLPLILVGSKSGYRIKKDKFSIDQLKSMSKEINKSFEVINDNIDLPV